MLFNALLVVRFSFSDPCQAVEVIVPRQESSIPFFKQQLDFSGHPCLSVWEDPDMSFHCNIVSAGLDVT